MTMTVAGVEFPDPVLPRSMSVQQWAALDIERNVELVAGVPVVSPYENAVNLHAAFRLGRMLEDRLASDYSVCPQVAVALTDTDGGRARAATIRIPDLVLVRGAVPDSLHIPAAQVALVVEVVSPTGVERDWVSKRAEYAVAGIEQYLIVDRFAQQLVLFAAVENGRYSTMVEGQSVTIAVGDAEIDVALTDLFD